MRFHTGSEEPPPEQLRPEPAGLSAGLSALLDMELEAVRGVRLRITADFDYRPEDPLVVRFTFHLPGDVPVRWAVSRELLLDGISGPTGEGDIHIRPADADGERILLLLRSPEGEARLTVDGTALHGLLLRTGLLVPFGEEWDEERLDEVLAELLATTDS